MRPVSHGSTSMRRSTVHLRLAVLSSALSFDSSNPRAHVVAVHLGAQTSPLHRIGLITMRAFGATQRFQDKACVAQRALLFIPFTLII